MKQFSSPMLFLFVMIAGVKSAKILMVAPMPTHSHFTVAFRLAKELADRGHQVTAITPYPQKIPIKNYRDISVEENIEAINGESMTSLLTEYTLANINVQKLMNSRETFDVIIVEHFLNDAAVGLGYHFKTPVILLSSVISSVMNNYIFANPAPASYVPAKGGVITKQMNFWQRIQNLLMINVFNLVMEFHHLPTQREIFKRYITNDVELDDVLYNVSLMLTNSHVSVSDAIPLVPSIKEIGGYHIAPPQKLPDDLQSFLDDAKQGAVLFSMGSTLKSTDLTPRIVNEILKAFSKIKQNVLWKFEADLPEAPDNVKIMKWLPQQDILAHPNVRAFITHGGFLSTVETVYHGVPVIGIPVFGDQKYNIAAAVSNGYAVSIALNELTEEKLSWALNEILNNPKYRENVQKRSKLMHDQPLKPIDAAVYWVEHVIRHKGAPYLRSAGLDLNWYQREMIDIILFLIFVIAVMLGVFYVAIKKLLRFAKILVVAPMPSYSQFSIPFKLATELASRNHEVTCINSYPQKNPINNYKDVPVKENIEIMEDEKKKLFELEQQGVMQGLTFLFDLMSSLTEHTLKNKNVEKLLASNKEFDVIIIETFLNDAFVGLGYRFKAPVILLSGMGSSPMNNHIFANPAPVSYIP
ncbi:UDPGT, Glyco tran 28 C and/or NAD binding 10 domain containing protein, partial [Asbolus verrucosus]